MRVWGRLLLCAALSAVATWAPPSLAQQVTTQTSARKVGVGETFQVQISLNLEDDAPDAEAPRLPVTGQAQVDGPSTGTSRRIMMHNFSMKSETQVTATWAITPTAPGTLTIGPGSFQVGNRRAIGQSFTVEVVQQSPGQRQQGSAPMDPFDALFGGRMGPFGRHAPEALPEAPPGLVRTDAPDGIGFLVTQLSKSRVVVGEPVVLTVYAYGSQGAFQEGNTVEPALGSALAYREVESSLEEQKYQTVIGDRVFQVAKLRQIVLIPLETGKLEIGPMTAALVGRGYPKKKSPIGYAVRSQPVELEVISPPEKGRPADYLLGDVGQFELEAELRPTELEVGEYAELIVRVSGQGNLPSRIPLPEGPSHEWQKPTLEGQPEARSGQVVGTRTIRVGLRALQPGVLDFREIRLPFYDPERGEYRVASAALPHITVRPGKQLPAPPAGTPAAPELNGEAKDQLSKTLLPRGALGPLVSNRAVSPQLLLGIAAAPLLAFGGLGLASGLSALKRRRQVSPPRPTERTPTQLLAEAERLRGRDSAAEMARILELLLTHLSRNGAALGLEDLSERLAMTRYGGRAMTAAEAEEALTRIKEQLKKGGSK